MLTADEQKLLESIIKNHATDQPYRVLVFGSRAKGTARKYSDVDVALVGKSRMASRTASALAEALEDSDLPYTVDVVDFTQAQPTLRQQIEQYGVELMHV